MPKKVSCLERPTLALVKIDKKSVKLYATCTMQTFFALSDGVSMRTYSKRFGITESLPVLRQKVGAHQSGTVHAIIVCGVTVRKDLVSLQNCKLRVGWGSAHLPSRYEAIDRFMVKRKLGQSPVEAEPNKPDENQDLSTAASSGSVCLQTFVASLEEPVAKRLCADASPDASLETAIQPGQGSNTDITNEEPAAQDNASMEPSPDEPKSDAIASVDTPLSVAHTLPEPCLTLLD